MLWGNPVINTTYTQQYMLKLSILGSNTNIAINIIQHWWEHCKAFNVKEILAKNAGRDHIRFKQEDFPHILISLSSVSPSIETQAESQLWRSYCQFSSLTPWIAGSILLILTLAMLYFYPRSFMVLGESLE